MKKLKKAVLLVVATCALQIMLTSCEEDMEIFDDVEQNTTEHNEKKQKPK